MNANITTESQLNYHFDTISAFSATPFNGTRCLIDCDGTIADSFRHYNSAIDKMFRGVLTDRAYADYRSEFDDAYDIIPGSPWRHILYQLIEFLTVIEPNKTDLNDNQKATLIADGLLRVSLGEKFYMLLLEGDYRVGVHKMNAPLDEHDKIAFSVSKKKIEEKYHKDCNEVLIDRLAVSCCEVNLFEISEFSRLVDIIDEPIDKGRRGYALMIDELISVLVNKFERLMCDYIDNLNEKDISIDPIVEFCREYTAFGGSIALHSGTNTAIVESILNKLELTDYIDEYICSDMLNISGGEIIPPQQPYSGNGSWGYKTDLINALIAYDVLERHATPQDALDALRSGKIEKPTDYRYFVIGDSKGDAFGAREADVKFVLVWRGYPKDPTCLGSADGSKIEPDFIVDMRPDVIEERGNDASAFKDEIKKLLEFVETV